MHGGFEVKTHPISHNSLCCFSVCMPKTKGQKDTTSYPLQLISSAICFMFEENYLAFATATDESKIHLFDDFPLILYQFRVKHDTGHQSRGEIPHPTTRPPQPVHATHLRWSTAS